MRKKEMIYLGIWFGLFTPNLLKSKGCLRINSFFLFLLLFGCNSGVESPSIKITSSEEVQLKDNLVPIAPIKSFDVLKDGSLVVITETFQIIRYAPNGDQLGFLTNLGQGGLELYSPSLVKAFNDGYVIWDESLLKMVEFNNNDQPINEYKGFNHAIRKFQVDEKYFYTYISPLPGQPFIQVFDKKNKTFVQHLGEATNSDILGNLNKCAGGLLFFGGNFIFLSSSALNIFVANKESLEIQKVVMLEVDDVKFTEFAQDAPSLINENISKAIEWSMSNSLITGVYRSDKNILVTGETGKVDLEENNIDLSNRRIFFLLLNENFDIVGKSYQKIDTNSSCVLWSDSGGMLSRITNKEGDDEYHYYFERISLE